MIDRNFECFVVELAKEDKEYLDYLKFKDVWWETNERFINLFEAHRQAWHEICNRGHEFLGKIYKRYYGNIVLSFRFFDTNIKVGNYDGDYFILYEPDQDEEYSNSTYIVLFDSKQELLDYFHQIDKINSLENES